MNDVRRGPGDEVASAELRLQVCAGIVDTQRGASPTGSASANVLASARSLRGESSRLTVEIGKFLDAIRAAYRAAHEAGVSQDEARAFIALVPRSELAVQPP